MFDERIRHAGAMDWVSRVRDAEGAVDLLDEVLVHRRLHGQNTSRLYADASREEFLRVLKRRLDRTRDAGVPRDGEDAS